jgi:hypothetical protein
MLGLVPLPADVAAALVFRGSAFRGGRIVAKLVTPSTLDEGGVVPCPNELDLTSEHAHPFARGLLADGVVFIQDSRDYRSRRFRKVKRIALPVGRDRERGLGEAWVSSEGLEQIGFVEAISDIIVHVFHVDPPELDPSPALCRDY